MKGRPKTIATTGGGQGSSAESSSDWQHTQQLSDQVRTVMYKMIKGVLFYNEKIILLSFTFNYSFLSRIDGFTSGIPSSS